MNNHSLGAMIKAARLNKGWTQGVLAEKIGVGERHIMGIENEGKSPSFEVLTALVLELNLPGDDVFYPQKKFEETELTALIRLLSRCNKHEISNVTALVQAMLDNRS